jgi:toxin ParE1/3/4
MRRVINAPEAEADIYGIARHIAEDDIEAACRFIETIYEKIQLLATHPQMGRLREELAENLRSFPVGPFVIFYRPISSGIEVARVLRGARDIPSLL